jgi:hypothetical protein
LLWWLSEPEVGLPGSERESDLPSLRQFLAYLEAEAEQEGASTTVSGAVVAIAQVIQWPVAFAA